MRFSPNEPNTPLPAETSELLARYTTPLHSRRDDLDGAGSLVAEATRGKRSLGQHFILNGTHPPENELSEIVVRRFQTRLALLFAHIVRSTESFARFGNAAGYRLQQRRFDLLDQRSSPNTVAGL